MSGPMKKTSSEALLSLADLVSHTYFLFGDKYYKQINGVAMGAYMGPTIKDKSVDTFEQNKRFLSASLRKLKKKTSFFVASLTRCPPFGNTLRLNTLR